jgi:hypothetical protein
MHPAAPSETVHIEGKALWGMVNVLSRRAMHWANGLIAAQAKAFANCQAYQGDLYVHRNNVLPMYGPVLILRTTRFNIGKFHVQPTGYIVFL